MKLSPSHLYTMKQQDKESFTDYIARFMDEHVKVVNCLNDMAMSYVNLNDKDLTIDLESKPPSSLKWNASSSKTLYWWTRVVESQQSEA